MTYAEQKHERQEAADSKKEAQLTAAMEELKLKSAIEELKSNIARTASNYDIDEEDLTKEVIIEL